MKNLEERLVLLLIEKAYVLTNELEKTSDLLKEVLLYGSLKEKNFILELSQAQELDDKLNSYAYTDKKKKPQTKKQRFEFQRNYTEKLRSNALRAGLLVMVVMMFLTYYGEFENIHEKKPFEIKTKYVIENLRGDTVDTWKSWRIVEDSTIHVNIVSSQDIPNEQLELIKNAIISEESIDVDDSITHKGPKGSASIYFKGWAGALKEGANVKTKYYIPEDIKIITSNEGEGNIILTLSNLLDSDGYTGYTKSTVAGNEILKSFITIYDVDNLADEQLSAIVRHEFGHALGLGHSTAPEDLMAPNIDMTVPYISECNVDAIVSLYNGNEDSKTVCEK